ncbi:hypothetical protein BOX15_Mlig033886g3 [Macrostomum lignano]|uniref:Dihydropteridine reductase n=1 Tax=Macrostomum lignano TaxID=282301 RepID=A0A267F622_9PLAT|nr:hypothetical protein BOX15_Mlig033886g3 [Macrostomum lignano]
MASAAYRVLVYGGRGALGSQCVAKLRSAGCWVCTVDLQHNDQSDACIVAPRSAQSLTEQEAAVMSSAGSIDGLSPHSLDAILCVAGGWAGGNAASKNFVRNCELVLQQSIWSSIIAARLASRYLRPGGLLTLSGAQAAASGGATPGMIGYGLAKAAVHQLTASLAAPKSGLPEGATVLALLPATLDTPANRRAMGDAKASGWTPLEFVADLLHSWLVDKDARPPSGSLLALVTRDSVTECDPSKAPRHVRLGQLVSLIG